MNYDCYIKVTIRTPLFDEMLELMDARTYHKIGDNFQKEVEGIGVVFTSTILVHDSCQFSVKEVIDKYEVYLKQVIEDYTDALEADIAGAELADEGGQ